MHRRNFFPTIVSIALGTVLAVGLLAVFNLGSSSAVAPSGSLVSVVQAHVDPVIDAQDAVSTGHVVVVFSGEEAAVRPISWTGTISRVGALRAAGFSVETSAGAICNIEGDGCPASDCFCADNWWWQGLWDGETDAWSAPWPLPDPADGDVLGFRNSTMWGPPVLPAQAFTQSLEALEWLETQQQADGSFGSPNYTAEALMAVGANGLDASTWGEAPSLLANVLSTGTEFADRNAAGAGKLAAALATQESCWPLGADSPLDHYHPVSGTFSSDTLYQAWGILGTAALKDTVPVSAVQSLKQNQQENGGWELFVGLGTDTNTTALALQALVAAGEPVTSTSVVSGLGYLENAQNDDGGFPYSPDSPWGTESDTNSTAYAVQALFATGEDPLTSTWAVTNTNPISYLLGMQLPNGSFEWQQGFGPDQIATQQAVLALLHAPFPIEAQDLEPCSGISGQVISGVGENGEPLDDVAVEATGAGDLFFGSTNASGVYTISVLSGGPYTLKPSLKGFEFTPPEQTVEVTETPGAVAPAADFAGETRVYLPSVTRNW